MGCSKQISQIDTQRISNIVQDISPKIAIDVPLVGHNEWVFDLSIVDSQTNVYIQKLNQRMAYKILSIDSISETQALKPIKAELKSYLECIRLIYCIDIEFPVVACRLNSEERRQKKDSLFSRACHLLDEYDSIKTAISFHANEFNRNSFALGLIDSLRYKRFINITRDKIVNDYVYFLKPEIKKLILAKK